MIVQVEPPVPDPGEWIKFISEHGALVVITSIAVMLVTWALIYTVREVVALIKYAVVRVFGEGGFAEQVVSEHNNLVTSVRQVNEQSVERQEKTDQQIKLLADKTDEIRTANQAEAVAAAALHKHFRDSHDFQLAVIETGVDMAEKAAEKVGMKDDFEEYIEKIRYLLAAKSAIKSDSIHG